MSSQHSSADQTIFEYSMRASECWTECLELLRGGRNPKPCVGHLDAPSQVVADFHRRETSFISVADLGAAAQSMQKPVDADTVLSVVEVERGARERLQRVCFLQLRLGGLPDVQQRQI